MTSTEILNEANQRTGREWTASQILLALKALLHDLARESLLIGRSSVTCEDEEPEYAIANAKKLIYAQIYDDSASQYNAPLDLITETEYREELGKNLSDSTPTKATFVDGSIYLSPAPDNDDDTLYYKVILGHADDVTTISFDDEFREGLIEGTCFKAYELVGLQGDPKALAHQALYVAEKDSYSRQMGRAQISKVRYTDI